MAEYHFFTTWDVEAPIEAVWQVISDPLHYPDWWKYVESVTEIEPSPPGGCGGLYVYRWKTALPYTLSFRMRHTAYEPPFVTAGEAKGELDGVGRWELKQMEGFTRVTYDWLVRTTKPWMNLLAPIGRPAFS
jgi:uncharacterized protein YndB with AHSA1/START domain